MRLEKATALLNLARELAGSAEGITLDEISISFGVSRRTAERMRDAVEAAFGPLELIDDGKKRRFRIAARGLGNFANAPTAQELAELENAVRRNELVERDAVRAQTLKSLSNKIRASLREQERRRLATDIDAYVRAEAFSRHVGPRPFPDANTFAALREALLAQRLITFSYPTAEGSSKRRTVVPYGILFGPRYYLVGAETKKEKPVLFRLDRITDVSVTDKPGIPPSSFSLADYADQSFGVYQEPPEEVELRFSAEVAEEAKSYLFHPSQGLEQGEDSSLIVRFCAGGMLEIARELLTWGNSVTVIKPKRLELILQKEIMELFDHHCKS